MNRSQAHAQFSALLNSLGVPPAALAAGIARACERLNREHPALCDRTLRNMWLEISPIIQPQIPRLTQTRDDIVVAAAVLIESYFIYSGNWKRMESHLQTAIPQTAHAQQLIAFIAEQLLDTAQMLDREHGGI